MRFPLNFAVVTAAILAFSLVMHLADKLITGLIKKAVRPCK